MTRGGRGRQFSRPGRLQGLAAGRLPIWTSRMLALVSVSALVALVSFPGGAGAAGGSTATTATTASPATPAPPAKPPSRSTTTGAPRPTVPPATTTTVASSTTTPGSVPKVPHKTTTTTTAKPGQTTTTAAGGAATTTVRGGTTTTTVAGGTAKPATPLAPIPAPPTASISASPPSGTAPLPVNFTLSAQAGAGATLSSWQLNFGDGRGTGFSGGAPPGTVSHTYNTPGTFQATLSVFQTDNQSDLVTTSLTVDNPAPGVAPTASLSATPTRGKTPLDVTFDGSAIPATSSIITQWTLSFGDGSSMGPVSGAPSGTLAHHTYNPIGSFTATLFVFQNDEQSAKASVTIITDPAGPTASLVVSKSTTVPMQVSFDGTGSSAEFCHTPPVCLFLQRWTLDFGDGNSTAGSFPNATATHTYASAGPFTATFTAFEGAPTTAGLVNGGLSASASKVISFALPPPTAKLVANPSVGTAPLQVSFDGSGSTPGAGSTFVSWTLNFGDPHNPGSVSGTGAPPAVTGTHLYIFPGVYTASLTVFQQQIDCGECGTQSASATASVTVNTPPQTTTTTTTTVKPATTTTTTTTVKPATTTTTSTTRPPTGTTGTTGTTATTGPPTATTVTTTTAPPATTTTTVTTPPATSPGGLDTNRQSIEPGAQLAVTGNGCVAGAAVSLSLGDQPVGTAVADANGHFSTTVSVGNASVGRHVLTAQCGPTLTTVVDVILASKVIQGASASIVVILFLMLVLGLFLAQFGNGRRT